MREYLVAALTNNGKLVHLVRTGTVRTVCGYQLFNINRVRARITCGACRRLRPDKTQRLEGRPHVVALNHEPYYRAISKALAAGATTMPRIKVKAWPVLA